VEAIMSTAAAAFKLTGVVPSVCDAEAGQRHGSRPRLVSVVDDDESVRESLPCLLGELGLAARVFASAEQFLASGYIRYTRCLILDLALPGMSGSELHRQLMLRGQFIPTIFITGQSDKTVRSGLLRQGAIECLFKPLSDEVLRSALDALDKGGGRAMRLFGEVDGDILGASATPCSHRLEIVHHGASHTHRIHRR
jgi:DNA-binding NtrC family response regulator